jgi:inosine-uridine nucleoside N-ribohydrolase
MPLDSTQVHLEHSALGAILAHGSPLTDQITLLYHQWTGANEWRSPTLYDPVAVTYTIRPDLCLAKPMRLDVDDKGNTRPVDGPPNVNVCLESKEKDFLDLLSTRIMSDPAK